MLILIAREFARSERPLAIGVGDLGTLRCINLLNLLADNLDKKGGVIQQHRGSYYGPLEELRPGDRFIEMYQTHWPQLLETDDFSALLIHQVNPLHVAPASRSKINAVPFIAGFSSFMDETMQLADLLLPDHSYLESWDINSSYSTAGGMVVTLTRPVASPEFNTRQTTDVLLELGRELGGGAATAVPYQSAEELVKQAAAGLSKHRGSINAELPEEFWQTLAERGVWIAEPEEKEEIAAKPATASLLRSFALGEMDHLRSQNRTVEEYRLKLLVYEQSSFGDGSLTNLPSLQELPDPVTSVMWGSWVELNPKTATQLNIADGDLVEVSTEHGSARVPAVLYPAIRPDVIAMPYGQGHTLYGRYAANRGVNPSVLNPALQGTIGAKVTKLAGEAKLIRFGTEMQERMEKRR
jgi:anaerobic selenocysteine-containing dehydrogenase